MAGVGVLSELILTQNNSKSRNPGGRFLCRAGATEGEFALMQGVEQGELFRNGPRGELAPKRAFAFQDFGEIKGHV